MANLNSAQIENIFREAGADIGRYGGVGNVMNITEGGQEGLVRSLAGGGSVGGVFPPFNFDIVAAEKSALEELKPYYERILKEEGGVGDRLVTGVQACALPIPASPSRWARWPN